MSDKFNWENISKAESDAQPKRAAPELQPDRVYEAVIHGQKVLVKRYPMVMPDPEDELTDEEREARDEAELMRLNSIFNPRSVSQPDEEFDDAVEDGRIDWGDDE